MKLKLLSIAIAVVAFTSCSKNNDEMPVPLASTDEQLLEKKMKTRPFNGVLTMHPDANAQLSCGCAPGYFEIGTFSGTGTITHFGMTSALTKPCVTNIPNGLEANTQCVTFVASNGDELYMEAAAPYNNVVNPTTNLIVGTGLFNITGGTGKYQSATGSYTATVINNSLIAPPGTAQVITLIAGTITY